MVMLVTPDGTVKVWAVPSAPVVPLYEHVTVAVLPESTAGGKPEGWVRRQL